MTEPGGAPPATGPPFNVTGDPAPGPRSPGRTPRPPAPLRPRKKQTFQRELLPTRRERREEEEEEPRGAAAENDGDGGSSGGREGSGGPGRRPPWSSPSWAVSVSECERVSLCVRRGRPTDGKREREGRREGGASERGSERVLLRGPARLPPRRGWPGRGRDSPFSFSFPPSLRPCLPDDSFCFLSVSDPLCPLPSLTRSSLDLPPLRTPPVLALRRAEGARGPCHESSLVHPVSVTVSTSSRPRRDV